MQHEKDRRRSGTHLWLVLMKAHRALQRLATRSIESSEAGLSDFAVLEMLLHKGPQPVNEIRRRIVDQKLVESLIRVANEVADRVAALGPLQAKG